MAVLLAAAPTCGTAISGEDASPDSKKRPIAAETAVSSDLVRLSQTDEVWIDGKRKQVVVCGKVCLRHGPLELFACPKGTKEHESIVAVNSKARFIHAGLLAVGAKPGSTVRFDPEYAPARGTVIDVFVLWVDERGERRRVRAQDWVRHIKSDRPMTFDWVFAGSGFTRDETTGKRIYHADQGDLICVSNFPTATLDLTVRSPSDTADLRFAANTDKIPPIGAEVRLLLIPRTPPAGHAIRRPVESSD
jgi:hypothetical protein